MRALAVLLFSLAAGPVAARTVPDDAVFAADFNAFLDEALHRLPSVPAVSVAVVHADRPVTVRALGLADVAAGRPASPETPFYIASSTKSFVGLAMARLAGRGEIDLDWTLADLAPDVAFDPAIEADKVTLRQLLSHSHGLGNEALTFRLAYGGNYDTAALWRSLALTRSNPEAPRGTFQYGNVGYNIAALLVERRLGRRWQDLVDTEVLAPLRLDGTFTQGLAGQDLARPYFGAAPGGPELLPLVKSEATLQSAGGMYSDADDMARWLEANLAAEEGQGDPALRLTHRPVVATDSTFARFRRTGYGLGWYSGDYDGATLYHAFGGFTGFRAHVSFQPARDIGVAVMTNDEGVCYQLTDVIAAYVYDWYDRGQDYARAQAESAMAALETVEAAFPGRIVADRAKRAARTWRLSLPVAAYAGRYCDAGYGELNVAVDGGVMTVRLGRLSAAAEPFTDADSARVELIPHSGEVMTFMPEEGVVTHVRLMDADFTRTDAPCP